MFKVLLASEGQLVVPFLSETADERFAQELIDTDALRTSEYLGTLADFPAVVVDGGERGVFLNPQWVEMAGDGFVEINLAFAESLLESAEAHAIGAVAGEHTVLALDNLSDEVALDVAVGHAFLFNSLFGSGEKIVPYLREHTLDLLFLLIRDRSTGIALDATFTEAFFEVAAKEAFNHVEGD